MKRFVFLTNILIWFISFPADSQKAKDAINDNSHQFSYSYYDSLSAANMNTVPQKSIEYGLKALELAKDNNEPENEANSYKRLGWVHFNLGDYNNSLEYYKLAIDLYKDLDLLLDEAILTNFVGSAYYRKGDYQKSSSAYYKTEKLCDELLQRGNEITSVKRLYAILYINMGILYHEMDSSQLANTYFKNALNHAQDIQDTTRITASYANMGMVFRADEKYDSASVYYSKALSLARKTQNTYYQKSILNNIANLHKDLHKPDSALHYFSKAKDIIVSTEDNYGHSLVNRNIAGIYLETGNTEKAIEILNEALEIAVKIESQPERMQCYRILSDAWLMKNETEKAFDFYKKYAALKDTVTGQETREKIAELQVQYETEKKDKQILALRADNNIKMLQLQRRNITLAGLFILVIALVIIFILYRSRFFAYKKLVEKNIKVIEAEDKLERNTALMADCPELENKEAMHSDNHYIREKDLAEKFETLMKNEKPYLSNQINMKELSAQLNTNRTYLSNAIKTAFARNFNTYINEARVKEAMRLLKSPEFDHYSVEGIGLQAGFNNRISFNSNFKKITGVSPSVFREYR
ncbi:MAG TPA: AraC family transcriptional regulator [Bacteroidales bacterium]|nr:AraC family transcriptional regulator [Bacteroidales bacterium]